MNTTRTMQPISAAQGGNVPALTSGPQSVVPGVVSPACFMNTSTMSSTGMGMPSPHQQGIGIKPQTPPANVLQVVKQVQEEAARQQQPHVGYGKVNPSVHVPGQAMPPPQVRATGHLGAGQGGNLLPMEQWQQRYPGDAGQGLRQPGPQLMQQQQAQGAEPMQCGTPTVRPETTALNNPGNIMMYKQAVQQLMQTLRSPQSPDQQQQILQILKSNPQLMAAFIKQRQVKVKQHQLQQRLQQVQLLRRRMAAMNTKHTMQSTNAVPGGNIPALTSGPQGVVPGAVSPACFMNLTMSSTGMGMPSPHQPGIGIKPQTPPANVLRVVKQVQEEAAQQEQPHVGYGKVNPSAGVPGQAMPPPQVRATGHLGTGHGTSFENCEIGAGQGLEQPGPQLTQQQAQLGAGPMQGGTLTVRPEATELNNPENTMICK